MLGCLPAISTGAAIPAPGSITVHPSGITYYAQLGDTLISIAQRWTNKTANWVALGKINQVNKDSNIPVGSPIVIPTELLADEASSVTGNEIKLPRTKH